MSEAAMKELRELSAAHAEGRLATTPYRERRARILDHLVGLAPPPPAGDVTRPRVPPSGAPAPKAPATVTPAPPPADDERTAPVSRPGPGSTPKKSSASLFLVLAAAVILAAAGGGWWWLHRAPAREESAALPPASGPAAVAEQGSEPAAAVDPAQLVAAFLQRDDWSDASVSALNSAWWNLSDAQVAPLLGQDSVKQLRSVLAAHLAAQVRRVQGGASRLDPSAPLILLARNLNVPIPDQAVTSFGPAVQAASAPAPAVAAAKAVPAPAPAPAPQKETPGTAAASAKPGIKAAAAPAAAATVNRSAASAPPGPGAAAPAQGAVAAGTTAAAAASDSCHDYFTNPRHRYCHDTLTGGSAGPALAIIPSGSYTMGGTTNPEELPAHNVVISRPFAVTIGEISAAAYAQFCTQTGRSCPAQPWPGEGLPAVNVSWSDANDFAAWLSRLTGQHYRLPSEAEWEYFARAGSHGDYWSDAPLNPGQAIFTSDTRSPQAPTEASGEAVAANSWSLKHVAGNVREWVADTWSDDYSGAPADGSARGGSGTLRVVRGGSYKDTLPKLRSAARVKLDAGTRDAVTGFRLVRDLVQ